MNTYHYEDISLGQEESFSVTVTEKAMDAFRSLTGDENPLHADAGYAASRGYGGRVVYGMLTASFFSTMAGVYLPGKYSLIHSVEVKFLRPIYPGMVLTVRGENGDGEKLCKGIMKVGVLDEE